MLLKKKNKQKQKKHWTWTGLSACGCVCVEGTGLKRPSLNLLHRICQIFKLNSQDLTLRVRFPSFSQLRWLPAALQRHACEMKWKFKFANNCMNRPVWIGPVMDWKPAWINAKADSKINNWQAEIGCFCDLPLPDCFFAGVLLSPFQLPASLPFALFCSLVSF